MHAPGQDTSKHPHITPQKLAEYDAFLLGIPTRYGNFPAQWKVFWDQTGGLWQSGGLAGKYAGLFVSTASLGGGQESTCLASMSTLAHHGILYVPFGYSHAFGEMVDLSEVHGGTPWGAGTFAVSFVGKPSLNQRYRLANGFGEKGSNGCTPTHRERARTRHQARRDLLPNRF